MKLRDLYLVTIGFIILGLGLALLNLGEGGSVFIFPFIFVGEFAPVLFVVSLFIVMMFFWWVNRSWMEDARFVQYQNQKQTYLRVGAFCQVCGNPLPENAVYCSVCGNSVERNYGDDQSF